MQADLAIRAAEELAALLSQSAQREAAMNEVALGLEGLEQALAAAHAANQDLHDHIRYLRKCPAFSPVCIRKNLNMFGLPSLKSEPQKNEADIKVAASCKLTAVVSVALRI